MRVSQSLARSRLPQVVSAGAVLPLDPSRYAYEERPGVALPEKASFSTPTAAGCAWARSRAAYR